MDEVTFKINDALGALSMFDIQSIDWDYKPLAGKWSKKEILGHLVDNALVNLQRFIRCTYEENFKLTYNQVAWVKAQRYHLANVNELLHLWRLLNHQIIAVLKNYPAERMVAQCDTGKTAVSLHTVMVCQ